MTPKAIVVIAAVACLSTICNAQATTKRSSHARTEFRHLHPCPSTGKSTGACPGFVIDHIDPLCHGGADDPRNMQWQTLPDSKKKDRLERQMCFHS